MDKEEVKDKHKIRIIDLLKSYSDGLTISDIMKKLGLSRHTVLARLHYLIGEGKVSVRQVNMAKLHFWEGKTEKTEEKKEESGEKIQKEIKVTPLKEEHIKVRHETNKETEIKWTPKMSVFEPNIDAQHQRLLIQINKLSKETSTESDLGKARGTFHFLDEYIKEHLAYEEQYMKKNNYPEIKEHKKIHRNFIKYFGEFKKRFHQSLYTKPEPGEFISESLKKISGECKTFLGDWWINHISTVDQQYAQYIAKKRKAGKKVAETIEEKPDFDMSKIKAEIDKELRTGNLKKHEAEIKKQRAPAAHVVKTLKYSEKRKTGKFIRTEIPGFDDLFEQGIPKGAAVLVAGGAGSGKTILCLQILANHANQGKKCLYMSFEESEERLTQHMQDFGWNVNRLIKKGNLLIKRFNPFDITRSVDALLMKAKGELLIDIDPIIFPEGFKPDFIVVDSLTAIASAFTGKEENYRVYIEQLFRFFEKIGATSFLITETKQIPTIFSQTGVEEFLADGVVVLYNIKRGNIRENAIEILKLRGAKHQKKIVAMQITDNGIEVYPEQEVFGGLGEAE